VWGSAVTIQLKEMEGMGFFMPPFSLKNKTKEMKHNDTE
jgi:hypothetical protein